MFRRLSFGLGFTRGRSSLERGGPEVLLRQNARGLPGWWVVGGAQGDEVRGGRWC